MRISDNITASYNKEELYEEVLPQARSLVSGETDLIANMANLSAILHRTFGFWWTGFYRVCGEELILGPFQESQADAEACASIAAKTMSLADLW